MLLLLWVVMEDELMVVIMINCCWFWDCCSVLLLDPLWWPELRVVGSLALVSPVDPPYIITCCSTSSDVIVGRCLAFWTSASS